MFKYICKRLLLMIPTVFAISIIIFGINKIMPGDPVETEIMAIIEKGGEGNNNIINDPQKLQNMKQQIRMSLGLDKPLHEQYFIWLTRFFSGNFGFSTKYKKPVMEVIKTPMTNTLILNFVVVSLSLTISIFVGINSAVKRGKFFDKFWQVFSLIGNSSPSVLVTTILIYIFSVNLKLLPSSGMPSVRLTGMEYYIAWIKHLILPVMSLTFLSLAGTIRHVRNAMLNALSQDYIRTAKAKGLSQRVVIYSHAFRNALIPVVTIVMSNIVMLFSGSVLVETVFAWNGIGTILLSSIHAQDYDIVVSLNFFTMLIFIFSNLITDVLYAVVDPRIKLK